MSNRKEGPSSAVKLRVMKRDRFTCTYCGASGTENELQVDHIIPSSKGGSNHISNLTTACVSCNQKKSDSTWAPNAPRRPNENSVFAGLFFFTFKKDGAVDKQGIVERDLGNGKILASFFSWFDGVQNGASVVMDSNDIIEWYTSEYSFQKAGAYYMAKSQEILHPDDLRAIKRLWDHYRNFDRYYEMMKRAESS